jgi:tRNA pseudouridine38-40 synthase
MHRIRITIEYDGTNYFGWQFQNNQITIQEEIERALFTIFNQKIRITGAGRTDSGVHALNQTAHLDIPEFDLNKLKHSMNGILKPDIRIKSVQKCTDNFHARFDAVARYYWYRISLQPTAIHRSFAWQIFFPMNITLLQEGAKIIAGTNNFKAFCKVKSEVKHYECRIFNSRWFFRDGLLVYEIAANRFLHGMVRAIVGSLIELSRGRLSLSDLKTIIEKKDRRLIPATAPAKGLFLKNVVY